MLPSLAAHLPPATRFLLEQLCPAEPREPVAPAEAGAQCLTASDIATEARRQLVGGPLLQWAERNPEHPWAASLAQELRPEQQAHAVQALNLVKQTLDVVAALQQRSIPAIALKGPFLSRRYYGDYGTRHSGDVDILVDEAAADEADRALRAAGYTRVKPRELLRDRRLRLYLDTQHEFGYTAPDGATSIELHWRHADCRRLSPVSFAEAWARAEGTQAGGAEVRTLGPTDTFLQLAIHGYIDGWSRLKWIADLPRVRAVLSGDDLAHITAVAERGGIGRILELALALGGCHPGGRHPGESRDPVSSPAWLPAALMYVAQRLQSPHPRFLPTADRWRHARAASRYTAAMLNDAPLRRAAAYCNLIMPADFDNLPLPDPLTPALPYLARIHRGLRVIGATPR